MEKTFVLKTVPYAAKKGGGTITKSSEAHLLAQGAIAVFLDNDVVATVDIAKISLDAKISVAVGYPTSDRDTSGNNAIKFSARVPAKNVLRTQVTEPIAPVAKVVTITGFTDTTGEAVVRLYQKSYDVTNNLQRFSVSLVRREGETLDAFVDRFILRFSSGNTSAGFTQKNLIATAKKVTIDTKVGIEFTALKPSIDLELAVDGIFDTAIKAVKTPQTVGLGQGYQVAKDEKDSTAMDGDSGYEVNDYFNRAGNVDMSLTYSALNVDIQRVHSSPTNRQNSMVSNITIYGKTADAGFGTAVTIFNALAGKVADPIPVGG